MRQNFKIDKKRREEAKRKKKEEKMKKRLNKDETADPQAPTEPAL